MSDATLPLSEAGQRLAAVRERIAAAAARVGRDPAEVAVVAVSKTWSADHVLGLARAGQLVFGENRVQEARDKIARVEEQWTGAPLVWRLVGHLQRNKVSEALGLFAWIDSVDSFRLLEAVAGEAARLGQHAAVLLQFNCSGETTKGGFRPEEVEALATRMPEMSSVRPGGLMTIGPLAPDPEAARTAFRMLRALRDFLSHRWGRPLPELSMGMSGDLEVGVEEGATLVRVGTALFGARG